MMFPGFDIDTFLRDHWQKKPLLIRNPWGHWVNPLEPDELAGLACEPEIESRLIVKTADNWAVEHGPFAEERFNRLGREPWTLLVQAVDHYIPAVAELIEPFRFIPDWRIDDVMVSYATDHGGVGAHFDQYDVFLIQGLGRRRWQVGQLCNNDSALLPHDDLRLLAHFDPTDEWVLEPGDMLYVPPGIAHNGVAMTDDCMTYSIGFRAPSSEELIGHWVDDLLAEAVADDRYADPLLARQPNPGEIRPEALASLHAMVMEKLSDPAAFARWFGQYNSGRKYPEIDWSPENAADPRYVAEMLRNGALLHRNPASRFSFIRQDNRLLLFVDGNCWDCDPDSTAFAENICARKSIAAESAWAESTQVTALITELINAGSLAIDEEDFH